MCGRSIASSDAREHWCCRGKGGPRPALPANPGGQNVTDVLTQDVTHVMTSNNFGLVRRSFEGAGDANAEDAFLVVAEDNFFVEGEHGGDAVDAEEIGGAAEDETGMLLQDWPLLAGDPVSFNFQLALLRAAFRQRDCAMTDVAHFGGVLGLDGFGVVPEIEAVNVAVVEPQAGVVRMVDALAGARFEREAAGDDGVFGGAKRIEHGLGELFGPDVGGEGLSIDGNVDAALGFVGDYADSFRGRVLLRGEAADEEC